MTWWRRKSVKFYPKSLKELVEGLKQGSGSRDALNARKKFISRMGNLKNTMNGDNKSQHIIKKLIIILSADRQAKHYLSNK